MFQDKKKKKQAPGMWKGSEGMLQVKSSIGRKKKSGLTGYQSFRKPEERIKETLRFENSYGNIALGGDKKGTMTILVSEKRRHNSPGISEKEKVLQEERQIERPIGRGKNLTNTGGREEGAFAFQYQPGVSRFWRMERMRQYMSEHEQETLNRMMPFMVTEKDIKKKRALESAARTLQEQGMKKGAEETGQLQARENRELEEKHQMENRFNQQLIQAMEEVKREAGKGFSQPFFAGRVLQGLMGELEDKTNPREDEEDPDEEEDPNEEENDNSPIVTENK